MEKVFTFQFKYLIIILVNNGFVVSEIGLSSLLCMYICSELTHGTVVFHNYLQIILGIQNIDDSQASMCSLTDTEGSGPMLCYL